ncbi:zinc-ribbon domain-containing protein [Evtepia gabavorous]|uniref:zinc-ribbon domain-containing protein n=1 Tax=Evtepia gabavorous TaxID=2211183 RepID=UPI0039B43F75
MAPGSRRRVWWQCPQGHTWQAAVFSRSQGADCPVCTGRTVLPGENDLATVFPQLARQWDQERNGALTPQQVSPYSNRAVWWRCGLGHSWHGGATAPTAPGGRSWRGSTTWRPGTPSWPRRGTLS